MVKWLSSAGSVGWARSINVGSKRGRAYVGLWARTCSQWRTGLARPVSWLVGPGDGPIDPTPRVMNSIYIYIFMLRLGSICTDGPIDPSPMG
jgi:hypothetical protein